MKLLGRLTDFRLTDFPKIKPKFNDICQFMSSHFMYIPNTLHRFRLFFVVAVVCLFVFSFLETLQILIYTKLPKADLE